MFSMLSRRAVRPTARLLAQRGASRAFHSAKSGLILPQTQTVLTSSSSSASSQQRSFAQAVDNGRFDAMSVINTLKSYPRTQISKLSNGLTVATEPASGETATIGVWIDTGSRYEDEKSNGVAHFLEHMFFKGTAKRGQYEFEKEIENMGGHLNAYTSREHTVFYAKVFKNDVRHAMDILSDILQNPLLDPVALERERGVIIRESEEVDSQPEEVVFDRLHETAFRGNSLGRTILGPIENIRNITREQLLDYINTHYTAPRMVIAGCGDIKHEDVVKYAQELFGNVPTEPKTGKKVQVQPALFTGSEIRVRYDDFPVGHVAVAWPTAGWTDPDNVPLMVLQSMLGHWDKNTVGGIHSSSDMIATVAKYNQAHSVAPFNTLYHDTGLFGVYAVAEPRLIEDLLSNIMTETVRHCYTVRDERVEQAKHQLAVSALNALDGTSAIAEDIGRQLLTYGRRMHPVETIARLASVDSAAVKNAANRFLHDRDVAFSAVGSIFDVPDYNWIRRRTYFTRY